MEVPVVASKSEVQQHSVEQNVDTQVHGGVGRRGADPQNFLPGQSPTARGCLGLYGFSAGQGPPSLRGADFHGLQTLVPGQGSTALRGADLHEDLNGFVPNRSWWWSSWLSPGTEFNSACWSSSSLFFITQVDTHRGGTSLEEAAP